MRYCKVIFRITKQNADEILTDGMLEQNIKDVLCAFAADAGFESFEEYEGGVCGYIQKQNFDPDVLDQALNMLPFDDIRVDYELSDVEDKDWNSEWEAAGFEPILIKGKCVIHDTLHPLETPSSDIMDVVIEAKQAFGTGTHETTRMIVSQLLDLELSDKNVLDCGCGTGILSIVASKAGAKHIDAYDIDEWSVRNIEHNSRLNNVENINAIEGTADVIPQFNKQFDIVLANINRNVLLADMPKFYSAMAPGAVLILSGFYVEDANLLKEEALMLGLCYTHSAESNDWCMLAFQKIGR